MVEEIWRPIADYPGYEVSDLGRVRRSLQCRTRKAGGLLSTRGLRAGYPCVDLCRDGKKRTHHVHRLVAEAFLEPSPGRNEVNHINGDKCDPRALNLEYVTRSENALHSYRTGLQTAKGSKNGQAKLTEADVVAIRMDALCGSCSFESIAARYGVAAQTIYGIVTRRKWQHVPESLMYDEASGVIEQL